MCLRLEDQQGNQENCLLSKGMRLSVRLKLLIFKYVDFKNKNQGVIKGNLLYTGKISGRN